MVEHLRGPFLLAQMFLLRILPGINTKLPVWDAIGLWSNRNEPLVAAHLRSLPYAASKVPIRRESREVLPAMVFTRSEIYISTQ